MRTTARSSLGLGRLTSPLGAALAVSLLLAVPLQANDTLYLIDGSSLYSVDTSTAVTALIGPASDDGLAPSENPASFLYCADNTPDLYSLPLDGGAQIFIATIDGDGNRGLAFNSNTGMLYGTDNSVFGSIERPSGSFVELASPPEEAEALAADPINNLVYGLETNEKPDLMVYDVATNSWSVVGTTTVADGDKAGLAYDPVAGILYASSRAGNGRLYRIDPATAATTLIGNTGVGDEGTGLAFASSLIFGDGFESGDTTVWSKTIP